MANLMDIVEVAEALKTKSVLVIEERCVVVRNRNVQCRKCIEACPNEVFTIENNVLTFENAACVACGSCTVVCPTTALISLKPLDEDLASDIADSCIHNKGAAVFACARISSKRLADSDDYAEVPCLARMEESVLLELVAQGVQQIMLIDGTCSTCKFHHCDAAIEATITSANTLLDAMGSSVKVERRSSFPDEMLTYDTTAAHQGVSRRNFFSQARGTAKDAAEKTVTSAIKANIPDQKINFRERFRISPEGILPQFDAARRMRVLDAMDRIGKPHLEEMETRLWGNVVIDTELCNSCNMCARFCPTGALKEIDDETRNRLRKEAPEGALVPSLEFSVADCVQCKTCEDICLKKCLKVESVVSLEELFDFEPRTIFLPPPPKKMGLFSRKSLR